MKLIQRNYNSLSKVSRIQFKEICKTLFPHLLFSKINKKGMLSIKDSKFSFNRHKISTHILSILLENIPDALSIKFWGNNSAKEYYIDRVNKALSKGGTEMENVENIISMFYSIGCSVNTSKAVSTPFINPGDKNSVEKEEIVVLQQEPLNILEFLLDGIKITRKKFNTKRYFIAAMFSTHLLINSINNKLKSEESILLIRKLSMRDPPCNNTIYYNSS